MTMWRMAITLCLAAVAVSFTGCGNSQAVLLNDVKQTGLAYHNYHDKHQQGPSSWNELIAFDKTTGGDGESIARVRDAGYEMKWNVKFSEVTEGMANTVLAERPGGGPKLMMDGSAG
jgi:hypothetical protein